MESPSGKREEAANKEASRLLHPAILRKDIPEIIHLIELGVDVDSPREHDRSPLQLASAIGSREICKLLLEKGNATMDNENMTPAPALHCAVFNSNSDVCVYLLEMGANPWLLVDSIGRTVFDVAKQYDKVDMLEAAISMARCRTMEPPPPPPLPPLPSLPQERGISQSSVCVGGRMSAEEGTFQNFNSEGTFQPISSIDRECIDMDIGYIHQEGAVQQVDLSESCAKIGASPTTDVAREKEDNSGNLTSICRETAMHGHVRDQNQAGRLFELEERFVAALKKEHLFEVNSLKEKLGQAQEALMKEIKNKVSGAAAKVESVDLKAKLVYVEEKLVQAQDDLKSASKSALDSSRYERELAAMVAELARKESERKHAGDKMTALERRYKALEERAAANVTRADALEVDLQRITKEERRQKLQADKYYGRHKKAEKDLEDLERTHTAAKERAVRSERREKTSSGKLAIVDSMLKSVQDKADDLEKQLKSANKKAQSAETKEIEFSKKLVEMEATLESTRASEKHFKAGLEEREKELATALAQETNVSKKLAEIEFALESTRASEDRLRADLGEREKKLASALELIDCDVAKKIADMQGQLAAAKLETTSLKESYKHAEQDRAALVKALDINKLFVKHELEWKERVDNLEAQARIDRKAYIDVCEANKKFAELERQWKEKSDIMDTLSADSESQYSALLEDKDRQIEELRAEKDKISSEFKVKMLAREEELGTTHQSKLEYSVQRLAQQSTALKKEVETLKEEAIVSQKNAADAIAEVKNVSSRNLGIERQRSLAMRKSAEERATLAEKEKLEAEKSAAHAEKTVGVCLARVIRAQMESTEAQDRAVAAEGRAALAEEGAKEAREKAIKAQSEATKAEEKVALADAKVADVGKDLVEAQSRAVEADSRAKEAEERAVRVEQYLVETKIALEEADANAARILSRERYSDDFDTWFQNYLLFVELLTKSRNGATGKWTLLIERASETQMAMEMLGKIIHPDAQKSFFKPFEVKMTNTSDGPQAKKKKKEDKLEHGQDYGGLTNALLSDVFSGLLQLEVLLPGESQERKLLFATDEGSTWTLPLKDDEITPHTARLYEAVGRLFLKAILAGAKHEAETPTLIPDVLFNPCFVHLCFDRGIAQRGANGLMTIEDVEVALQSLLPPTNFGLWSAEKLIEEEATMDWATGDDADATPVTLENFEMYRRNFLERILSTRLRAFEHMKKGFFLTIGKEPLGYIQPLQVFTSKQLRAMLCGQEVNPELILSALDFVDGNDIRGRKKEHPGDSWSCEEMQNTKQWLIEFIRSMETKECEDLLHYCAAVVRLPYSQENFRISVIARGGSELPDKLPSASTCFKSLFVPAYSDYDTLQKSFRIAFEHGGRYFGTD